MGYLDYSPGGEVTGRALTWIAPPGSGTNINIFLDPLLTTEDVLHAEPLAKAGEMMSYQQFDRLDDELTDSAPAQVSAPTVEPPSVAYAPEYRTTRVEVGMSGGIPFVICTAHTRRDDPSEPSGEVDYRFDRIIHKSGLDTAFGAPDISFKTGFTSLVLQAGDPATGTTTVFGGIKYKKDKSKKNSFYYEFLLLTFDHAGAVINREMVTSTVPLSIREVHNFQERQLAPDVYETSHAAFIAHGDGDKKMSGVNKQLRRVFIVDPQTGTLVRQVDYTVPTDETVPLETRNLGDGSIEVTHAYPVLEERGFSWLRITKDGELDRLDFATLKCFTKN